MLKSVQLSDGKKAFINICQSEAVEKASSKPALGKVHGEDWSIPFSLSPGREDLDKSGQRCMVYDVVYHPETFEKSTLVRCYAYLCCMWGVFSDGSNVCVCRGSDIISCTRIPDLKTFLLKLQLMGLKENWKWSWIERQGKSSKWNTKEYPIPLLSGRKLRYHFN